MNHRHPADHGNAKRTKRTKRTKTTSKKIQMSKSRLALAAASTTLFAVTAWFAASAFSSSPRNQANQILLSHFHVSFSLTITVLRILQGLTSTFTAAAVAQTFEEIQWTLASRDDGFRILSFLGIAPSTSISE